MHKIDTKNLNIRTDLIIEKENNIGNTTKEIIDNINITRHKKEDDLYITLEFNDITDYEEREKVGKLLEKEIKKILEYESIKEKDEVLIVGLGNRLSTPDSLGPKVVDNILITRHLFYLNLDVKQGIRSVSALSLGVLGSTGIETTDIIKGVIEKTNPKFLIVIDSLCARNVERLNKTIQLTNTGIHPGSGVDNKRKELTKKTLNIPIIALGVPTVVTSSTIVSDTIEYLFMHINYLKNNYDTSKLVVNRKDNYLSRIKENNLNKEEKESLGGLLGSLNEIDKYNLINEVLNSINYNLIVTPKEVDFLIDKLSNVISSSINNAIHKEIDNY